MSLIKELNILRGKAGLFMRRPSLSFKLLGQWPMTLRGFNHSKEWRPSVSSLPPGSPEASLPPNPLETYFKSHKGEKGVLKWAHYFDAYHSHFKKFVGRDVRVLEIGVYGGGSLEMWRNYFGPKCRIYGVDIEECCKEYENEYTSIFIGDQSDRKFWKQFKEKVPGVDIVIDDGGHQVEQQIVTLEEMLPHISPGGVYLCEDIIGSDNRFTSYLHGLAMGLNDINWISEDHAAPTRYQSRIKSIHFYPYITVITKHDRPKDEFTILKLGTKWPEFGPTPRNAGSV